MDRSLVQTERSLLGTATRSGVGTIEKMQTTSPHTGTVVDHPHARPSPSGAAGHGVRDVVVSRTVYAGGSSCFARRADPVVVPMELVCTRRMMPAADVSRNRPPRRPFVNHAPNTHARQGVQ